jgi:hypothetical protein
MTTGPIGFNDTAITVVSLWQSPQDKITVELGCGKYRPMNIQQGRIKTPLEW